MDRAHWNRTRFSVGITLVVVAALILFFTDGYYSVSASLGICIIGLAMITNSKKG